MNAKGKPENLKPFVKGDKRINRKGKPKDFTALRELAQQIAHEAITQEDGATITTAELIMRKWATSSDPQLQMRYVEIAFGKVPNTVEVSGPKGGPIEHKDVGLSDEERAIRVAKLLDAARARRAGSTAPDGETV